MTSKVDINFLSTGVPGLDEVLGGGLPELSFNLISGPPGCGKTTLAHQLMFAMASPERPAIYFSILGEPPLKMLRYQQLFSFFDLDAIGRSVRFVNLAQEALSGDPGTVLARILDEVRASGPALVFIDSFRAVSLANTTLGSEHNAIQHFLQQLCLLMTSWQATTFLIGEYFGPQSSPVFTVADGVISLDQCVERNSMVRKLQVGKMRGRPSQPGLHSFRISQAGLEVFGPADTRTPPPAPAFSTPAESRARFGIDALDDMLGGGLPRGYSLLVAGPSGSGKSLLSAAFLEEGARNGETGVLAVFEQRPTWARNQALDQLIASGQLGVIDSRAPDLSIDELVVRLRAEIRRLRASRVVIDSLSGFELSLAPTFSADFRQSLARLVVALASEGVSMLMTSELEDRYGDLRFSPHGTAFLTDAIIVQRYIEVDSRLRRVMAVVKVRGSTHSNQLREFTVDEGRIQVGDMLLDQEGLLGGRPTRKAAVDDPAAPGVPPVQP